MCSPGYLRSYIIYPSAVWGIARNPLVDAGIAIPYSGGVNVMIRAALERGRAGQVGNGQAQLPCINVEERTSSLLTLDPLTQNLCRGGFFPSAV